MLKLSSLRLILLYRPHKMATLLSLLTVLSCVAFASSQCISANDIPVNETSVGEAVRTLIDGSLHFSLEMLRVLNSEQQRKSDSRGLFFSPFSVWSALMVTYMGANGPTEQEMRYVLGVGDTDKITAWGAYRNLRYFSLNTPGQRSNGDPSYRVANRIYFQEGTSFRDCIRELMDSEIAFVDYEQKPEAARETINEWVEKETAQKIKDLIPQGSISALTRMVVANAVYFKESWMQEFDPMKTRRGRFTLANRSDVFTDMMSTRGRFLYSVSEELQCSALELPYSGNELSMIILLPNNKYFGLNALANSLTPERLRNLMSEMYPREVLVSIPKFHIEDSFELTSALNKIGLRTLFDPRQVDLSGFTGQKDFVVDAVIHKSFIDVNEQGTEAAAATAILTSRTARPLGPAAFYADHPFAFFIRDNFSNIILFMGIVQRPSDATKQ